MIACDSCGVANMAESKFCRECGSTIAPPAERPMSDEDQKMVHDAQRMFGEGRYDEAAMVAVAILEQNPYCVPALAIKGDCHERVGEYRQALGTYRDILKVQPDSQLDRIRVARLEKIVSSGDIEIGPPSNRRRTALGAAIAAAILLVSSGTALILASQATETSASATGSDRSYVSEPFLPIARVPGGGNTYFVPNTQAAPQNSDMADLPGATTGGGNVTPLIQPGDSQRIFDGSLRRNPGVLNDPTTTRTVGPDDVRPLDPNVPPGFGGAPPGSRTGDPDPTVVANGDGGSGRNSIVDIRPSQGSGTTNSGNQTADDRGAQIDMLVRKARDKYVTGDYAVAADAYEKALALGASPASTNQRLAQCYEKLGEKAKAIAAYTRAIKAFEQMDQNDERVLTQLESCRAALKLLRGN